MRSKFLCLFILSGYLFYTNTLFAWHNPDSLLGANHQYRNWWDVKKYKVQIKADTLSSNITGTVQMHFKIIGNAQDTLQIDLQEPLLLNKVYFQDSIPLRFYKYQNHYFVLTAPKQKIVQHEQSYTLTMQYSGQVIEAKNPPWQGGWVRTRDSLNRSWIAVACQGTGASVWWPCKDLQADEPDNGIEFILDHNDKTNVISNGRKIASTVAHKDSAWSVKNTINNYDLTFYWGHYRSWKDTFQGINGVLDISYYALDYHYDKAKIQFQQVKKMLRAFEYWLGPYPFYEDSYKIIEAPYLGMEHQSAIAYGNQYQNGYLGLDRSATGNGLLFDFIIIHESGHEWFGNSITAADIAENWIHEGFTSYTEVLYLDYYYGKEKAYQYARGVWKNIKNDTPVIGHLGVHDEGSGDKYDKASGLVHTIRLLLNDDIQFRALLHGINKKFYHKIISSNDIENYIDSFCAYNLKPIFNQYLRSTKIPKMLWYISPKGELYYQFENIVEDFELPIPCKINGKKQTLNVSAALKKYPSIKRIKHFEVIPSFLIQTSQKKL